MKARIIKYAGTNEIYGILFICPGCKLLKRQAAGHVILPVYWTPPGVEPDPSNDGPRWQFNGDMEKPTFLPSILSKWQGHDIPGKPQVCHSFVREGRIEFLTDCTHALAGKTVELPDLGEDYDHQE
jgi:hypothetical protein